MKYCSNVAQSAKKCFRVLKMQNSAPNSKKCSKGAQRNRERPNCHMKMPNFTFCEGRKQAMSKFSYCDWWTGASGILMYQYWLVQFSCRVGLSRLRWAPFEHFFEFGALFCILSTLKHFFALWATFEQYFTFRENFEQQMCSKIF